MGLVIVSASMQEVWEVRIGSAGGGIGAWWDSARGVWSGAGGSVIRRARWKLIQCRVAVGSTVNGRLTVPLNDSGMVLPRSGDDGGCGRRLLGAAARQPRDRGGRNGSARSSE